MTDTVNFSLKIKDEQLLTESRLVGYLDVCAVTNGLTKFMQGQVYYEVST